MESPTGITKQRKGPIWQTKVLWRRFQAHYPIENGIKFVHHSPARGNIGDLLCSPRHYFSFQQPKKNLIIIGGGVFVENGYRFLRKMGYSPNQCVLWGTGLSIKPGEKLTKVADLEYLDWGLRDIDRVCSPDRFLPCVSCMHPMLDSGKQAPKTLLFLNADPKVTSVHEHSKIEALAESRNWSYVLNNCSEDTIRASLAQCDHVITNSFHGGYWGLLSGKHVTLLGYSSKFSSLLKAMELDPEKIIPIGRGEGDLLKELSEISRMGSSSQILTNHKKTREAFIQINLRFAERLKAAGAFKNYKLKYSSQP